MVWRRSDDDTGRVSNLLYRSGWDSKEFEKWVQGWRDQGYKVWKQGNKWYLAAPGGLAVYDNRGSPYTVEEFDISKDGYVTRTGNISMHPGGPSSPFPPAQGGIEYLEQQLRRRSMGMFDDVYTHAKKSQGRYTPHGYVSGYAADAKSRAAALSAAGVGNRPVNLDTATYGGRGTTGGGGTSGHVGGFTGSYGGQRGSYRGGRTRFHPSFFAGGGLSGLSGLLGQLGGGGGGGGGMLAQLAGQYGQGFEQAKAANEARYQQGLDIYKQREAMADQMFAGQQERIGRQITEGATAAGTKAAQQAISSGLATTTAAMDQQSSIQDRAARARAEAEADLTARRARMQAGLMQDRAGFIERRRDAYPNVGQLASLAQGAGRAGGGGRYGGLDKLIRGIAQPQFKMYGYSIGRGVGR